MWGRLFEENSRTKKRDLDLNKYGPECILSLDETAIKKGLVWDTGLHTFGGWTTVIKGIGCLEKKTCFKSFGVYVERS